MNTGTILGAVRDTSGGVVPGATVTITNVGTGVATALQTAEYGSYVAPYLLPGAYEVTITKPGFKTQVKSGIGGVCLREQHKKCLWTPDNQLLQSRYQRFAS